MTINYDKIQKDVKALGSQTNNASFLEGFLSAFNFPKATFARLSPSSQNGINQGTFVQRKIYFLPTTANNLYSEFNILKKNDLAKVNTDFIIVVNETDLIAYEKASGEMLETSKSDLYRHVEFFFSLVGIKPNTVEDEVKSADMKAAEKFAKLYNELLINNFGRNNDIGELICRLLLCCFADSIGVLTNGSLRSMVINYTDTSVSNLDKFINNLFKAMKSEKRDQLPGYFANVKFINHCLFVTDIDSLAYSRTARDFIIDLFGLDWSEISPETLGGLIQSIIRSDDRNSNSNYTATANIQKVICPLFLDELYRNFEKVKGSREGCEVLLKRVLGISVFDPSCGAGNFLLVAYKELNKLANRINETIKNLADASESKHQVLSPLIPVTNFYGIDDDYFSCAIARLGFLFVVCQEKHNHDDMDTFFANAVEILFSFNIVTANATEIDWETICSGDDETYIIGNPSYTGARKQTPSQKKDLSHVFSSYRKIGNLDHAACWFMLATKYICAHGGGFAFVTTNSLTQGEQVQLLWPKLFEKGVHIRFAYTSFKWKNNARNRTSVSVVVIGIVPNSNKHSCELFTPTTVFEPISISPYLVPGKTIVKRRHEPISKLPRMEKGNMPLYWSDYFLSHEEKVDIVSRDFRAKKFLKKVIGANEFIKGIERWCFWIRDTELQEAMTIPCIAERVEYVKQARLASGDKSARSHAAHSHRFRETNETYKSSLVVPSVSSENRLYIPIGFIDKNIIVTNLAFVIYDCEPWIFGVVGSKMHNIWIRTVCGALETRTRYSSQLGYNTFPFPDISKKQKDEITQRVLAIIAARERYSGMTYAEWYDPIKMPNELHEAHYLLDLIIDHCYRDTPFVSDRERLEYLFERYNTLGG
jgi:hypothetical protein